MQKYIVRRALLAIPTLFGLTVLIFAIMRVMPGDPLATFIDGDYEARLTEEQIALIKKDLGLDRPLVVQYAKWMRDVLTGSFGYTLHRKEPIIEIVKMRGIISAEIGLIAVIGSWIIGLPVGILSAIKPNSIWDILASSTTVLFLAIPNFWLGLLILLTAITFWNYHPPLVGVPLWEDPWANFQIVIGPAMVLATSMAAIIARMARSSLFEVLREDYVRTARAKGLREWPTIVSHALPNALLPVLTISGVMLGFVLGGSVAVEVAFNTPGIGNTMITAAETRDMHIVQSLVLLYGIIFVVVNLLVDLMYALIDPRIKFA